MKRSLVRTLLRGTSLAALIILVAACGTTTPTPDPTVNSVTIDGGDADVAVGGTIQLSVTVDVSGGASTDVTWISDDETVATVSDTGLVEGVAEGTATITATSQADTTKSDSVEVQVVVSQPVTNVTIVEGPQTLDVGEQRQLTVTVEPAGASNAVTWSSDDESVVTVSDTGLIEAVGANASAVVTATSDVSPGVSDSVTVNVNALNLDTVYVDASAAAGGNGSQSAPFQTITDGIAAVNAGGVVNVAAGTYPESLSITKSLTLAGAGAGAVTIQSDDNAPAPFPGSSIDIRNVSDVTLSGFRLEVVAPGPDFAAIGMLDGNASDITIENVDIEHTNDLRRTRGVAIIGGTGITVRDTTILATPDGANFNHEGAGVSVTGTSSGIELDGVETTGHESFAGLALVPNADAAVISGVNVTNASTFNEVNKLTVGGSSGGTVTDLTAPQFVVAVGNPAPAYGGGQRFFYKDDVDQAILDSLFNFEENDPTNGDIAAWPRSTIQTLDPTDQSIRENNFILGTAEGTPYGYPGAVRSHFIQAAEDIATAGATLNLQAGTFAGSSPSLADPNVPTVDGATTIDVPNVTIEGQGGTSIVGADTGPVFTIDADGVTISSVEIDADPGVTGIFIGVGDLLTVETSNLLADVAIDNDGNLDVAAGNNWWGDASGPSGTGFAGTGSEVIDPAGGGEVTVAPIADTMF